MASSSASRSNSGKLRRSVCLFGTSANPPTGMGGHRGIVSALSALPRDIPNVVVAIDNDNNTSSNIPHCSYQFDEIRVVPVYRHMFTEKRGNQASFEDRMEMCRLAFEGIERVTVSDCERICFEKAAEGLNEGEKSSLRVGTADLLDMLIANEPDTDFSFALGADTFMDLTTFKWRRSHDVMDLMQSRLLVIYRLLDSESKFCEHDLKERIEKVNKDQHRKQAGDTSMQESRGESSKGPARLLQIPTLSATSSSLVRATADESKLSDLVVPEVLEYIKKRGLYAFAEGQ